MGRFNRKPELNVMMCKYVIFPINLLGSPRSLFDASILHAVVGSL